MIEQFEHVYYNGMDGWEPGLAVRRDWPDGCHELVGFSVEGEGYRKTGHYQSANRPGEIRFDSHIDGAKPQDTRVL